MSFALATLLPLLLSAPSVPGAFAVDPAASVVGFHLEHKLHKVDGRSTAVEGKAVVEADGKVLAMFRIPVASFDTADGNRDSHMRDTLEASKFPFVVLKAVGRLALPVAAGSAVDAKVQGELDFHGVKRSLEIPVRISFDADGAAAVKATFPVSLEAHRIERPALLFVKVEDQLLVNAELRLKAAPR
jgi:polyisoprenoid-binding protein YceI